MNLVGKGIVQQMEESNVLHYDQFSIVTLEYTLLGMSGEDTRFLERIKKLFPKYTEELLISIHNTMDLKSQRALFHSLNNLLNDYEI